MMDVHLPMRLTQCSAPDCWSENDHPCDERLRHYIFGSVTDSVHLKRHQLIDAEQIYRCHSQSGTVTDANATNTQVSFRSYVV